MYTPQEFRDKAIAVERDFVGNIRFFVVSSAATGGFYYFDLPSLGIWGMAISLIAAVVAISVGIKASIWDAAACLAFYHSEIDKNHRKENSEWFSLVEEWISTVRRRDDGQASR